SAPPSGLHQQPQHQRRPGRSGQYARGQPRPTEGLSGQEVRDHHDHGPAQGGGRQGGPAPGQAPGHRRGQQGHEGQRPGGGGGRGGQQRADPQGGQSGPAGPGAQPVRQFPAQVGRGQPDVQHRPGGQEHHQQDGQDRDP